jgi:hypothetical protein
MVVQAHTILREYCSEFADRHVLVLGGKGADMRAVAKR